MAYFSVISIRRFFNPECLLDDLTAFLETYQFVFIVGGVEMHRCPVCQLDGGVDLGLGLTGTRRPLPRAIEFKAERGTKIILALYPFKPPTEKAGVPFHVTKLLHITYVFELSNGSQATLATAFNPGLSYTKVKVISPSRNKDGTDNKYA